MKLVGEVLSGIGISGLINPSKSETVLPISVSIDVNMDEEEWKTSLGARMPSPRISNKWEITPIVES
ncbi:hypothetical protein DIJ64_00280 [Mycobacterium leprae]|uniref:Uncharacterized protein n=1 Tax=Mycobacterium leprae TaxID=1769 RepID=A0AAD0KTJ1_MYCLR|nr:hypothetical protein DIJ64_00280 [Mycobacterium leprae]OAR20362.1 hypothetical protein A8144_11045 [Mycobacterium leprae 3125609]OAX70670.1 hypothetical protein A3216_10505 [Mycobacterium leprae 7935681]